MDVLLDTTPPYGSIRPADPALIQSQRATQIHINAFDDMSRVEPGGQIRLSHDGIVWEDPVPYQPLVPWEWSPGEGEKWVHAIFRDRAGNWMKEPVSARIILDTQAPAVLQTVPSADAQNVDFRIRELSLNFSEPLDLRETPTIHVRGSASGPIAAQTIVETQGLAIRLDQTLAPQERVTVTLLSRIPDAVRNMLPAGYTFSFETAPAMLPGDTNLDGRVDVDDLHTVIQYWGESGPRRIAMQWRYWRPQPVPLWPVESAAYADANGDGKVGAADILPLGVHWGRRRPWAAETGNWQLSVRYLQEYAEMHAILASSLMASERSKVLEQQLKDILTPEVEPQTRTELLPAYPNPFSERVWFPFRLGESSDVTVRIFGLKGDLIRTFIFRNVPPGFHDSLNTAPNWDGTDARGLPVASGSYWVQVQMADISRTSVIVLVR